MNGVLLGQKTAEKLLQLADGAAAPRDLVAVKRRVDVSGRPATVIGGRITVVHGALDATYDVQPANGADELLNVAPIGRCVKPPKAHWLPSAVGDPCMLIVLPSLDGETLEYHLLTPTEELQTVICNTG